LLSALDSGVQGMPFRGPPPHVPLPQTPGVPPTQVEQVRTGSMAPVRYICELSGRVRLLRAPVLHVTEPVPTPVRFAMTLMTQVPVAVVTGFGIARGAPKRQPGLVQWRVP